MSPGAANDGPEGVHGARGLLGGDLPRRCPVRRRILELLADGESALLVPAGDPAALAAAVRRLAGDAVLAQSIGAGGLAAYRMHASERVLGERWRGLVEQLAGR